MKKVFFIILLLSTNLICTAKDKEIKIGVNIGLVNDSAWFYNGVAWNKYIYREATLERYAMSGELQTKF
ncbi:hypothetical protein [Caviibacter abscessus]|uniref:hypothetical protein n=1 Tax=Caviibacter abscessus TaxID=1766719 RepID=UPI000837994C|nr:hypothetical protein [Caviibacter abscessus]